MNLQCGVVDNDIFGLQALTIHFQSYANKMTISIAVDPSVIPDPHFLCDDLEASLKRITDVANKTLMPDVL